MQAQTYEGGPDTMITCHIGNASDSMSKVERYQWKIQDEPGNLTKLEKNKLNIDHSYQRELNDKKVLDIARDWSWVACAVIVVALRNGFYFIIDGQHRWAAAMRRSDINMLPCIVFRTKNIKKEAKGFFEAQTKRKPLYGAEKLPALIAMENPDALLVKRLIDSSGRKVAKNSRPNTVQCISMMLRWANESPDLLEKMWPLIINISQGHVLSEKLLSGILYLEKNLIEGLSLMDQIFYQRLLKIGCDEINKAIGRATAFYSKGGARIYATGIIQAVNKGAHKNILEMKEK